MCVNVLQYSSRDLTGPILSGRVVNIGGVDSYHGKADQKSKGGCGGVIIRSEITEITEITEISEILNGDIKRR